MGFSAWRQGRERRGRRDLQQLEEGVHGVETLSAWRQGQRRERNPYDSKRLPGWVHGGRAGVGWGGITDGPQTVMNQEISWYEYLV